MANAKSLIIIKPMSAQLQKLYEVLTTVATEENIEIFATDNLGELAQLYAMGGQHLTLVADPKLCAIFLQQNRTLSHAKHNKTLLLTPKPLPPKIMDKFIKLGLTENLLDTAPPKTLLYKVKLLLKSIKSNEKLEDKVEKQEQVIKSMVDLSEPVTNGIAEIQHANDQATTEDKQSLAEELKKKKIELDLEPGLDYLKEVKKKKVYQEDSIQTNWISKKSTSETNLDFDETNPDEKKKKETNNNELDGYFRSKEIKKIDLDLVESAPVEAKKKNILLDESDEDTSKTRVKKPQTEIELTDSSDRTSKKSTYIEEVEDDYSKVKSLKGTQIDFEEENKASKNTGVQFAEDEASPPKRKKEQIEIELEASTKEKKHNSNEDEESSGNMIGKIKSTKTTEIELEEGVKGKEEKLYEKSEEAAKLKKHALELAIEEAKRERKEKTNANEIDQDPNFKQRQVNKTEIDFENDSSLKKKTLDLDAADAQDGKLRKKGTTLDLENSDNYGENKKKYEKDDQDDLNSRGKKDIKDLLDAGAEEEKSRNKNAQEEDTSGEFNRKKIASIQGEFDESDRDREKAEADKTAAEKDKRKSLKELELAQSDARDEKAKAIYQEREENLKAKAKSSIELEIEAGKKHRDGTVEQIDSYMRSNGSKLTDQDWSQKKKSQESSFKLTSTSQSEVEIQRAARRDAGEITIDYRMLRDEFNELAKSGYKAPKSEEDEKNQSELNEDEDSSFKVIELKANGFDYAINIINQYNAKEIKAPAIYKNIAQKLLTEEKAYCVFYTYLNISKEHKESFSSFKEFQPAPVEYWEEFKKEQTHLDYLFEKTMSAWLCREIKDKDSFWVDTELPSWAPQELTNKVVEYIYPYYDGLDRMGMAYLYFPEGINPHNEKKIIVLLELLRGVFLETIQRNGSASAEGDDTGSTIENDKPGKVLGFIGSLFGKKKTG
jgi:hypothetical protein